MTTVGELKKFLEKWHDAAIITVDMGSNTKVKGLELSYDICTDGMNIVPIFEKNAFIIEAKR